MDSAANISRSAYRSWDEKKVVEWLHTLRCGQYEAVFRGKGLPRLLFCRQTTDTRCQPIANNFTGDNLLDCDQKILQEMGIKKIGDRVRISVAAKQLRTKTITFRKSRNRVSFPISQSD